MSSIMEEIREEGREAGRKEGREAGRKEGREAGRKEGEARTRDRMIDALMLHNSEESLLHSESFAGLNITKGEIDAARKRLAM